MRSFWFDLFWLDQFFYSYYPMAYSEMRVAIEQEVAVVVRVWGVVAVIAVDDDDDKDCVDWHCCGH